MLYLYGLLILLLFLTAYIDKRQHRIPNWVVGLIIVGGAARVALDPLCGISFGFLGFFAGLLPLMAIHLLTGIGAGDVKLLAAIGTIVGAKSVLLIICYSFLLSGLWAWGLIFVNGAGMDIINRYGQFLLGLTKGRLKLEKPNTHSIAANELPLAPGIAIAAAYVLLPDLLAFMPTRQL